MKETSPQNFVDDRLILFIGLAESTKASILWQNVATLL